MFQTTNQILWFSYGFPMVSPHDLDDLGGVPPMTGWKPPDFVVTLSKSSKAYSQWAASCHLFGELNGKRAALKTWFLNNAG